MSRHVPTGPTDPGKRAEQARQRPFTTSLPGTLAPEETQLLGESLTEASVGAFRLGIGVIGALALLAGLLGVVGIRGRQRTFEAVGCPGGLLAGAHRDLT